MDLLKENIRMESYNKLVNISEHEHENANNFLKSLNYKDNAFKLLDIIDYIKSILKNNNVELYPSFFNDDHSSSKKFFEYIEFKFSDFDSKDVFKYISNDDNIITKCKRISFNKSNDHISLCLKNDRSYENLNLCEIFEQE